MATLMVLEKNHFVIEKMFRQSLSKILLGSSFLPARGLHTSTTHWGRRPTKLRRASAEAKFKALPVDEKDFALIMKQLSRMKSFEMKVVTTTLHVKARGLK